MPDEKIITDLAELRDIEIVKTPPNSGAFLKTCSSEFAIQSRTSLTLVHIE